ncbi:MAG: glycosyltransferase family 4 protein [Hahellaceae bacterium]|nr:glycosyltransferase family 4 protein [Hahellaceae bacterium]MCP5210562.1 glycosyltransferase family 4 protein [Hahellaceae bacterium]
MKVLQVLPALNSGGVEKGTLEIADALVSQGHVSWVLSAGGRLVSPLCENGTQHKAWDIGRKSPLTLLQIPKVRRWLQAEKFDIIHLRSRMPAWIIWQAWKHMPLASRPRLISTVHGLHSVSKYSEIVTCGERVIVVSETCKAYVLQNYPKTDINKIRLIYRGIDPALFPWQFQPSEQWKESFLKQFPTLRDRPIITLPGRLTRLKGHHDLVEIFKNIQARHPQARALIVGGEDPKRKTYAKALYQKVEAEGLTEQIIFAGHQTDMKEIYAISTAVLSLSSKPESFGRTVLEALSLGTPVLGYAHGGVGEILARLYPYGACEKGNLNAVAAKLDALLESKSIERPIKNETFLLSAMQEQTLQLYHELLAENLS